MFCKIAPNGTDLLYSTYLGGSNDDGFLSKKISVDNEGNVYVAGNTWSFEFPITNNVFDNLLGASPDILIAKLNTSTSTLEYSTFFGGSTDDFIYGMDIDSAGYVYLTGLTRSSDFPIIPGSNLNAGTKNPDSTPAAFISKLHLIEIDSTPDARFLAFSSYSMQNTVIFEGDTAELYPIGTSGNNPAVFQWDLGTGGEISTEIYPTHQYDNPGNFTITLSITDVNGDFSSESMIITILKRKSNNISGYSLYFMILGSIIAVYYISSKRRNN